MIVENTVNSKHHTIE